MSDRPLDPLPDGWSSRTRAGARMVGQHERWLATLIVLVRHEFRARYRTQALGAIWSILQPLVMMGLLGAVLARGLGTGKNYPIHLLVGLIFWSFVSTSLDAAVGSLVAKATIIKHTMLPRRLLPLSVLLSYLVNLGIETCVLGALLVVFPDAMQLSPALLVVPLVLVALVGLVAGAALIGAALNVMYRDVGYIVRTSLTILFWLTPVVYALDRIGEPMRSIVALNPLTAMLQAIRGAAMDGAMPTAAAWALIFGSSIVVFSLGWLVFARLERAMLDRV